MVLRFKAHKMLLSLKFVSKEQCNPVASQSYRGSGALSEKKEGRAKDGGVSGNLIILAHEEKVCETLISCYFFAALRLTSDSDYSL